MIFKKPQPFGSPTISMLRCLVGIEMFLFFVVFPASAILTSFYGAPASTDDAPLTTVDLIGVAALVVAFPLLIASWSGMLLLKNWARWVYLSLFAVVLVADVPFTMWSPFEAVDETRLGDLVGTVGLYVESAIVAIAFFSPVSNAFVTRKAVLA